MQKNKRPVFIQIQHHYFKIDEIIKVINREKRGGESCTRVITKNSYSNFDGITAEDILKRIDAKIIKED